MLKESDCYIHIPEFDLTSKERKFLLDHYLKNMDRDVYYIAKDGTHDGNVWNGCIDLQKIPFMAKRVNRLQVKWKAYFHLQRPYALVEAHRDESRLSVLNIPIQNVLDTPTLWYQDFPLAHQEPVFKTQYGEKSFLINTQEVHAVKNENPNLRLMFQISMQYPFKELCEKYYRGHLIAVSKDIF